jgi:hypothetical protein
VAIDCRGETDPQLKQFKLEWIFSTIYEYIRLRGRRQQPLGLIIDEFASLCHKVPSGENPMATMLDEFINQYMRNHHIWLTVAHQSLYQLDEDLRNTLLSLGTYVFGRAATMSEARLLADVLYKRDPYLVKHWRKVWMSGGSLYGRPLAPFVADEEPEFMSLEEQQEEAARGIAELRLFEFLLRPALGEGEVSKTVIPISIANTVRDTETGEHQFPDQEAVAKFRSLLTAHAGVSLRTLLAEQDALLASLSRQQPRQTRQQPPHIGHGKNHQQGAEATSGQTPGAPPAPAKPTLPTQRRHVLS